MCNLNAAAANDETLHAALKIDLLANWAIVIL
jgi:hypothetical protein